MGAPVPVTCVRITADDPAAAQAMADGFVLSVECGGSLAGPAGSGGCRPESTTSS